MDGVGPLGIKWPGIDGMAMFVDAILMIGVGQEIDVMPVMAARVACDQVLDRQPVLQIYDVTSQLGQLHVVHGDPPSMLFFATARPGDIAGVAQCDACRGRNGAVGHPDRQSHISLPSRPRSPPGR